MPKVDSSVCRAATSPDMEEQRTIDKGAVPKSISKRRGGGRANHNRVEVLQPSCAPDEKRRARCRISPSRDEAGGFPVPSAERAACPDKASGCETSRIQGD